MRKAIPARMKTMPRYIGLRLILKAPSVVKIFDSSNGLTVVPNLLNVQSAHRFSATPAARGARPTILQGKETNWRSGNRKWRTAINTMATKKYAGGIVLIS